MSKAIEILNELKQINEMARIGEEGLYSFWVYTEPLKNPSFHLKHKTDFEIVIQAKDFSILEIIHNESRFNFKKRELPPNEVLKIIKHFFKSKNKKLSKQTNQETFEFLWDALND